MSNGDKVSVILLAAGKGSRMKSALPKILHPVGGLALINHLLVTTRQLNPRNIAVVVGGEDVEKVKQEIIQHNPDLVSRLHFVLQEERNGTGGATRVAAQALGAQLAENVVIICGDIPLISFDSLKDMLYRLNTREPEHENALALLSFNAPSDNTSYGRLVLNEKEDSVSRIVEFKDANEAERKITLCNSGVIAVKSQYLLPLLSRLDNKNAAKEYYLTDIVKLAVAQGLYCRHLLVPELEVRGANTKVELADIEQVFQDRQRRRFMDAGVTLLDPGSTFFSYDTEIEGEVTIYPQVFLSSGVKIKAGATIFPYCFLQEVTIGNNVQVGPFARTRGGVILEENSKMGSFVEMKHTYVGRGSKVPHLSYVGDAELGENTNIGGGTITCNYDGYHKSSTFIGDGVLVGSNNSLVAPINIGNNVVTGAGSVLTDNVPADSMALGRAKQVNMQGRAVKYHQLKRARNKK